MKVHKFYVVNVPETVNVATLQPPAGAGNVVKVFVPGATDIPAAPGALTITIPEPPAAPIFNPLVAVFPPPPPPPPVLTVPELATITGKLEPVPPPPVPPAPPIPPQLGAEYPPPPPPPA